MCHWLLGISHVSSLKGIVGDFSLINPYGVRVKGFLCVCLGLRVARSSGSGLRVRSCDVVDSPVFNRGVLLFPFPHPLFPSHH